MPRTTPVGFSKGNQLGSAVRFIQSKSDSNLCGDVPDIISLSEDQVEEAMNHTTKASPAVTTTIVPEIDL